MTTALITGCTGQDGSYLTELLLGKGYKVFGGARFSVSPNTKYIDHVKDDENFKMVDMDMQDASSIDFAVRESDPDEVYNLAAISYAPVSWKIASQTMDVNSTGLVRLLEAVRRNQPRAKVYQASTSEMYGSHRQIPQNETTPMSPVHPYGVSKLAAHNCARVYREQYGMHVSAGVLFNHESPRRGKQFVTRKITSYVARLMATPSHKSIEPLVLWTLKPRRDWGFSKDYVEAMWLMLQRPLPGDYCIGTGKDWSIEELLEAAFDCGDLQWRDHVLVNPPDWFTPDEESRFVADYTKASIDLGWKPRTSFQDLIKMMVEEDYKELSK